MKISKEFKIGLFVVSVIASSASVPAVFPFEHPLAASVHKSTEMTKSNLRMNLFLIVYSFQPVYLYVLKRECFIFE